MGENLDDYTGSGRTGVLPDLVLMPPGFKEWGEAERRFGNDHIRRASLGVAMSPPDVQIGVIQKALDDVKSGDFSIGSVWLDTALQAADNFPFMVWCCLRRKHASEYPNEETTLGYIDRLSEERKGILQRAIFELWEVALPEPMQIKNLSGTLASENTEGKSANVPNS